MSLSVYRSAIGRRILTVFAVLFLSGFVLLSQAVGAQPPTGLPGDRPLGQEAALTLISTPTPTNNCGWRVVSSPNIDPSNNWLYGVDAISADDIWAVGRQGGSTLTQHWEGSQWMIVPSPSLGTSYLRDVEGISADDVWAVGDAYPPPETMLIMHWDGSEWNLVPTPSGLPFPNLWDVEAVSANDVWVVGAYSSFPYRSTLILHWDGSQWTRVPSPNPSPDGNELFGLAVVSANDMWAVGYAGNETLVLRWNGTAWTVVPSPDPSPFDNTLYGVTALSATDAWAVGAAGMSPRTLTMHWDGQAWTAVPSPNLGSGQNNLRRVDAVAPDDVWAVGYMGEYVSPMTVVEHWDGSQWTLVPGPDGPPHTNYLYGLTAVTSNDVWAVGHNYVASLGRWRTLVGRYGGLCPLPTGTPPTSTPTRTPTPSATPVPCNDYGITLSSGGVIVPGTKDTGLKCDDCTTTIPLPFTYYFYNQPFDSVTISSNGNLQFLSNSSAYANSCLPTTVFDYAIMPYWDDLLLYGRFGVFTSISGSAPNRIFNIELRAGCPHECDLNFEVRLYEGQNRFDFVYGHLNWQGGATIGVQKGTGESFTQYSCNTYSVTPGLLLTFTQAPCSTGTPIPPTSTPTSTYTRTAIITTTPTNPSASPTATNSVSSTATNRASDTVIPSATPCQIVFTDVAPDSTFHPFIRCLACRGVISGYSDGTFRPGNDVTRGQLSKIVANAAGYNEPVSGQRFSDVLPGSTFYEYIERLAARGIIDGYSDGTFRPGNPATRGQIAKIVANAAHFNEPVSGQRFSDVPPTNTFYEFIERIAARGIISGYSDGTFRPQNNATRGQTSKIVANTFFTACSTPSRQ